MRPNQYLRLALVVVGPLVAGLRVAVALLLPISPPLWLL
jgi:hypothetical protein